MIEITISSTNNTVEKNAIAELIRRKLLAEGLNVQTTSPDLTNIVASAIVQATKPDIKITIKEK